MVQVASVDCVDKPARVSMPQSAPKMQPQQPLAGRGGGGELGHAGFSGRCGHVSCDTNVLLHCALSQRAADKWKPLVASSVAATAALYDSLIIYD